MPLFCVTINSWCSHILVGRHIFLPEMIIADPSSSPAFDQSLYRSIALSIVLWLSSLARSIALSLYEYRSILVPLYFAAWWYCQVMDREGENDHLMKAVMRALNSAEEKVLPITQVRQ